MKMLSAIGDYFRELADQFGQGWNRFWFTARDPFALGVMRILLGLATFGWLAEQYIATHLPSQKQGRQIEARIRNHLLPSWRDIAVRDLRKADLRARTKVLISEGKPGAAYAVHDSAKRILNWGVTEYEEELGTETSPFAGLKPPTKTQPRSRYLRDSEIKLLWPAWEWPMSAKTGSIWAGIISPCQTRSLPGTHCIPNPKCWKSENPNQNRSGVLSKSKHAA